MGAEAGTVGAEEGTVRVGAGTVAGTMEPEIVGAEARTEAGSVG